MQRLERVNDMVIRFANVNGTGSASANDLFSKAIFRMGIPVSPKNIFPSNIQGLPTWYEVRVSGEGYLGRRAGVDIMVSVNPQSMARDVADVKPGGYFIYDNTKKLRESYIRDDIHYISVPMMKMSMENFNHPRQQQLFKNIIYVGALAALINIDMDILKGMIADQFKKKAKLIPPNYLALDLGVNYIKAHYDPLPLQLKRLDEVGDRILIDGNTSAAIGAIYGGATVAAWYPITPSTSVVNGFMRYTKMLRHDEETGRSKYAIVQAEDELAAMGMVIGASWNGARAFTATSGPGVSLMSEFIGLAYFAEIPVVLINVQRGGPSTGMPTRTQQGDIIASAYCSHGDTKHVLLFPSTPKECFDLTAEAFNLAEQLQTPVIVMSDLDLAMNDNMSDPFSWDDDKKYERGKVLSHEDLEKIERYGRYLDVDGDGIPYRTIPGTHPTKGSYFTRGTSKDEYAQYTESGEAYVRNVDRLIKKFNTAKDYVPAPQLYLGEKKNDHGIIFFGTTIHAAKEAADLMVEDDIKLDGMRILAFPFGKDVEAFLDSYEYVFVVEQNRDAQFRQLLMNELEVDPKKLIPVLNYDGLPITADAIRKQILEKYPVKQIAHETQEER